MRAHKALEVDNKIFRYKNGQFGSETLKFKYIKSPIFRTFQDANGQCPVIYSPKKITQKTSVVVSSF